MLPMSMNAEQAPPKRRGCFFYGCLSCIILSLVVVLVGYLGFRYLSNKVLEFTDTKPILIESVQVSPAQLNALTNRIAAFARGLEEQKLPQELRLTAEDLNVLIASDPSAKELKNKIFIIIDDDRIQGKVSWPLDNFGPLRLKGRYLNGLATFKASLQNGNLQVVLDGLEVNGKPVPAQTLAAFKNQNLAQNVQNDPRNAQLLQRFESIQITNAAVILRSKVKGTTAAP